jgi:RNA methyltransferase, TrmH family
MPLSKNRMKSLRNLLHKKYREQENQFLIEGWRLCEEAFLSGALIKEIFLTETPEKDRYSRLVQNFSQRHIPISAIDQTSLQRLADTETPQGILALAQIPAPLLSDWTTVTDSLILAVAELHDPGNLGTLLRTADWFGVKRVLIGRGSVELYNPKVIRSSMGSIFHLQCHVEVDLAVELLQMRKNGFQVLATVVENGAPLHPANLKAVVLVGSEAEGLPQELLAIADEQITIPKLGQAESLNAAIAAGIMLYELTRR